MKIASSLKVLACAASALAMSSAANAAVYLFSVTGNGQTWSWYMDLDPSTAYAGNVPPAETFSVDPVTDGGYFIVTDVQGDAGSLPGFYDNRVANVAFYLEGGLQLITPPYASPSVQLDFYGDKLFDGDLYSPLFLPTDGSRGSTSSPWTLIDGNDVEYTFTIEDCGCDPVAAVPEPATWGMMIAGFGIMGAALRSRRLRVSFGGKAVA